MKNCKTGSRKIRDTSVVSRLNMKQKVLITGGSGLLGINWAFSLKETCRVIVTVHNREVGLDGIEKVQVDMGSVKDVQSTLSKVKPDIVIHTVGVTSVEKCEANADLARTINVQLASNVAQACNRLGIKLVHISTDHLFSGSVEMSDERNVVEPLNRYGCTKADAEKVVLDACPNALVVRTNFYGWGTSYRQSFSDQVIKALRLGEIVTLYQDVFYTPIIIDELVSAVHGLIDMSHSGIVNVASDDRISKLNFGLLLAKKFDLNPGLIIPGFIKNRTDLVVRPKDMSLSNSLVCRLLGRKLGTVSDHVNILKKREVEGLAERLIKL